MDHRARGNGAKLSKLQIEELHQYSSKELFGANASTVDGQFWSVEDLIHVVREQYGVEYKDAARYGIDRLKEIVPVWKKEIEPQGQEWVEGRYIRNAGESISFGKTQLVFLIALCIE